MLATALPTLPAETGDHRRRRDPEARPQQILDAAFHEFAAHGLAGARLDDIARRANVAKGTIYLYFPNKEALFREMVRATIIAAIESAEAHLAATDATSAEAQFRSVASGWWAFLRTERFQVVQRLVQLDLRHFPDLLQYYAEEVIARGRRLIGGIVAYGTARGEFRAVDPDVGARMFAALAMTHSAWCNWRACAPSILARSDDEARDEVIEFYLHALRPALAATPPSDLSPCAP